MVNFMPTLVLFDFGASDSFVCSHFTAKVDFVTSVPYNEVVSVPSGTIVSCSSVFENVPVRIKDMDFSTKLIEFPSLLGFDVVLGWDWLEEYDVKVECGLENITLKGKGGKCVSYFRSRPKPGAKIISYLQIHNHVREKDEVFICHIQDLRSKDKPFHEIPIVCEFPDVFQMTSHKCLQLVKLSSPSSWNK